MTLTPFAGQIDRATGRSSGVEKLATKDREYLHSYLASRLYWFVIRRICDPVAQCVSSQNIAPDLRNQWWPTAAYLLPHRQNRPVTFTRSEVAWVMSAAVLSISWDPETVINNAAARRGNVA